jgi:Rod binding domain-containing protein
MMKIGPLAPTSTFGLGTDTKAEETRAKEALAKADGSAKADGKNAIDPEKLRLAREFEQIFIRKMLSSLEKAGQKDGAGAAAGGGSAYGGMVVSALAEAVSKGGGMGLADVIARAASQPGGTAGPTVPSMADLQAAVAKATTEPHTQTAIGLNRPASSDQAAGIPIASRPGAPYFHPVPSIKINHDK